MEKKRLPLTLYRVLAYVTGVWLLLLTFVAMPVKYLYDEDTWLMPAIAIPHGYIYMVYVLVVLWLAMDRKWPALRTVGVMLAGTIPVLGFFVEHRIVRQEKAAEATPQSASTPTAER
ncbi:DUF3817 domain-containing protein [Marinactinospora thermotolerans]|uniref:Integral membrane protein n=1 Tax=Marinactinospora thermotolerans DSM 45154 TaxID=1122192 RepID=A0A1T4T1I4_9ACTN|nr:DUF3817 domain-containing protein [Marinactinospora thermotolerans]SKA34272.1 integral membrane protein [Marinactinospora thermotolerans DSM 45154]